jgi:hypothetical protein
MFVAFVYILNSPDDPSQFGQIELPLFIMKNEMTNISWSQLKIVHTERLSEVSSVHSTLENSLINR